MLQSHINFLAVLVAAIASMAIGAIWYGPLFGKAYMNAMGKGNMTPEQEAGMKKGMGLSYFYQFLGSLVMAFILAGFVGRLGIYNFAGGLRLAFWAWLGFIVPIKLSDALWGGKKVMFWLSVGNMLITLLVMGAIIGAWR